MELLENPIARFRLVHCLRYSVPFDKDPLEWKLKHPRCQVKTRNSSYARP